MSGTNYAMVVNEVVHEVVSAETYSVFNSTVQATFIACPNNVAAGHSYVSASKTWAAPTPLVAYAPTPAYPTLSPFDFSLLFTTAEYVAITISIDPYVKAIWSLYEAALASGTMIYLGAERVQTPLAYMSANPSGSPILEAGRAAQISAGIAPSASGEGVSVASDLSVKKKGSR